MFSQSGVPTGVPPVGNYDGALRPQIHYSPPVGFMVRLNSSLEGGPVFFRRRGTPATAVFHFGGGGLHDSNDSK